MSLPDSNRPSLSSYNAPEEWIRFYDKPSILKPFDSIQVRPHEAPVRPREAPVRPRETPVERWDRINVDPPNIKVNPFDCIADRTYVAPGERWPRLSGDPPIRPRSSISKVYDEEFRFKGLMYEGQNVAELDLTGNRGCINYFKKKMENSDGEDSDRSINSSYNRGGVRSRIRHRASSVKHRTDRSFTRYAV